MREINVRNKINQAKPSSLSATVEFSSLSCRGERLMPSAEALLIAGVRPKFGHFSIGMTLNEALQIVARDGMTAAVIDKPSVEFSEHRLYSHDHILRVNHRMLECTFDPRSQRLKSITVKKSDPQLMQALQPIALAFSGRESRFSLFNGKEFVNCNDLVSALPSVELGKYQSDGTYVLTYPQLGLKFFFEADQKTACVPQDHPRLVEVDGKRFSPEVNKIELFGSDIGLNSGTFLVTVQAEVAPSLRIGESANAIYVSSGCAQDFICEVPETNLTISDKEENVFELRNCGLSVELYDESGHIKSVRLFTNCPVSDYFGSFEVAQFGVQHNGKQVFDFTTPVSDAVTSVCKSCQLDRARVQPVVKNCESNNTHVYRFPSLGLQIESIIRTGYICMIELFQPSKSRAEYSNDAHGRSDVASLEHDAHPNAHPDISSDPAAPVDVSGTKAQGHAKGEKRAKEPKTSPIVK